ncbi:MAG: helix-turn-helix transcriptional regulator [Kiritimatiellia bacterium]
MDNMMGKRIKDWREARNLTQQQLAELLGISGQQVSEYERGRKRPPADKLVLLSEILGISTDFLLGRSSMPNASISPNPSEQLLQIGAYLRGVASEEDVKFILDFLETRRAAKAATEAMKAAANAIKIPDN